MQAQTTYLAAERRGYIADDASDNQMLNTLAVRTAHGNYLLAEKSAPLIVVSLVAALSASICFLP